MALSTRLTVKQTQKLAITPELRQAIELLQMSTPQLADFIEAEVQSNALLELEPTVESASEPASPEEVPEWNYSAQDFVTGAASNQSGSTPNPIDRVAQTRSLTDHLADQIALIECDPATTQLAGIIIHELDDDGYLRTNLDNIARRSGCKTDDIDEALRLVQRCEPTGIAARNLAECFALQLLETGEMTPLMEAFLETIDDLATLPRKALWSKLGISPETYSELLATIKKLNPAPGKAFDSGFVEYALPDATVFRNNMGGWSVELNRSLLPAFSINDDLLKKMNAGEKADIKYANDCSKRARWLGRAIDQRSMTILRVVSEIVRVQEAFFSMGVSHLKPLTMRDVAETLKLNESTISRVANGKFLSCERGTFELRYFFSKAIRTKGGNASVSSASIQEKIRKLIEEEDISKILSDDKIVKILNEDGVDIARRTVTKYRESMNIPSSVERRRFKANLDKIR